PPTNPAMPLPGYYFTPPLQRLEKLPTIALLRGHSQSVLNGPTNTVLRSSGGRVLTATSRRRASSCSPIQCSLRISFAHSHDDCCPTTTKLSSCDGSMDDLPSRFLLSWLIAWTQISVGRPARGGQVLPPLGQPLLSDPVILCIIF